MKYILSTALATILLLINNVEARWKPTPGMTWNYVLGDDNFNVRIEKAQVIDVDYQKSIESIKEYHNAGKKVICYFSGGTLEKHRHDKDQFYKVEGLVRNKYEEWSDENWLDIRKSGLKPILTNRIKDSVNKNCDAIEVDNLDGFQQSEVKSWSNPITKADAIAFAKWLGSTAHELGISIGLKNALFMIDEVGSYFDFAINESCATISNPECHLYKDFLSQGKAVFGVSYESRMSSNTDFCKSLNGLNISMIVKKDQILRQEGYTFDGKSQCGSGFKTGSSGTPSNSEPENSGNTKSGSTAGSSSNSSGSSNSSDKSSTTATSNTKNGNKDGANNGKSSSSAVSSAVAENIKATDASDALYSKDKNESDDKSKAEKDKNPDGQNDENKEDEGGNGKGLLTGIAVTGSIAGAAGVFILIKKNPRQYENLKRNISRKASSVKRSASTVKRKASLVTKKLTSKKPKRANYTNLDYNFYDDDALDLNNNPYSNYRYKFTQNLNC